MKFDFCIWNISTCLKRVFYLCIDLDLLQNLRSICIKSFTLSIEPIINLNPDESKLWTDLGENKMAPQVLKKEPCTVKSHKTSILKTRRNWPHDIHNCEQCRGFKFFVFCHRFHVFEIILAQEIPGHFVSTELIKWFFN